MDVGGGGEVLVELCVIGEHGVLSRGNIGGEADLKQTMEKQLSKQDEMLTQMKIIMRDGVIVKGAETLWK